MALPGAGRLATPNLADIQAKLAAQRRHDLKPMRANREVQKHGRADEHQREEEESGNLGHRSFP